MPSTTISVISALAAVISAIAAVIAVVWAHIARKTSERIFRRQGVIDLHMAWQGVNRINSQKPITGHVVKAVSVLELTAALWNHDIIEKNILYQSYWDDYRELVDTLSGSRTPVPKMTRRCCDFITQPVRDAYQEMDAFEPH